MKTLYAAFDDAAKAETAAEALLQAGASAKDISLVVSERAKRQLERPSPENEMNVTPMRSDQMSIDPLGNHHRYGPAIIAGGTVSESSIGATNTNEAAVGTELNPAQDDYPRTGSVATTELSSRPPTAHQDYNPDLDTRDYDEDYQNQTDHEIADDIKKDRTLRSEMNRTPESDHGPIETVRDISHRTIADPATTAKRTAVIGLGVGALAAASAIAIPGFGLVLGGGALAAAAATIAAARGNEEVAGGVAGWLQENGVPADAMPDFRAAYEGNGAILTFEDGLPNAEDILRRQGATHVGRYEIGDGH